MTGTRSSAAFYADSLDAFLRASDDEVYAPLTSPHGYTLAPEQLSAWRLQLGKKGTFCFSGRKAECPLFGLGQSATERDGRGSTTGSTTT